MTIFASQSLKLNKMEKQILDVQVEGFENSVISEDSENWYVDLRTGLGEGIYPKDSFSLDEAINDQVNIGE